MVVLLSVAWSFAARRLHAHAMRLSSSYCTVHGWSYADQQAKALSARLEASSSSSAP